MSTTTMKKAIGIIAIVLVLGWIFYLAADTIGAKNAAIALAESIAATSILVVGVKLVINDKKE